MFTPSRAANIPARPRPGSLHAPRRRNDPLPHYAEIRDGALMEGTARPEPMGLSGLLLWAALICLGWLLTAWVIAPALFTLFDFALGRI